MRSTRLFRSAGRLTIASSWSVDEGCVYINVCDVHFAVALSRLLEQGNRAQRSEVRARVEHGEI
jgi:hypothetical protein